ncbi:MAG: DUF2911 domain-containing protein [Acidobacteriota bacterium]
MKKLFSLITLMTIVSVTVFAQMTGDRGVAELALSGGKVSVEYGRPSLKGRDIEKMLNEQLPVGTAWRMGSNAATTLTADADLKFGKTVVAKGKYVLQAKRAEDQKWILVLTAENQTPVEVPLTFKKSDQSAEMLTIALTAKGKDGKFLLHWGTFTLSTEFKKA